MEMTYQKSIAGAEIKFIFGLAILVSLFNISMLREHQILNSQIALVILATTVAFRFDYFLLTKLFNKFDQEKKQCSSIDGAINSALRNMLKWPLLFKTLKKYSRLLQPLKN